MSGTKLAQMAQMAQSGRETRMYKIEKFMQNGAKLNNMLIIGTHFCASLCHFVPTKSRLNLHKRKKWHMAQPSTTYKNI